VCRSALFSNVFKKILTARATHAHLHHDLVDKRTLPINNPTTQRGAEREKKTILCVTLRTSCVTVSVCLLSECVFVTSHATHAHFPHDLVDKGAQFRV
jgi:hypothetical protein